MTLGESGRSGQLSPVALASVHFAVGGAVFAIVAIVIFIIAALGRVDIGSVTLVPLGLAFTVLHLLVGTWLLPDRLRK